jgi:nucleoside 2-deoxyribosyltransferase
MNIVKPKIYLAGGITKFGREKYVEGNKWRDDLISATNNDYFHFINPNDHFKCWDDGEYESWKEVMRFDLNIVRTSDIIIVNFNDPKSIGTQTEISVAYEMRKPLIGLNLESATNENLHPWQVEMCDRIFHDIDSLAKYLNAHYAL